MAWPIAKRSIVIGKRKSSVSLEEPFWTSLKEIAKTRGKPLSELVDEIASGHQHSNLSSAIRLFVLDYFKSRGTA
jgi:predicted DNA-binding ribbon-helix-helix protein